MIRCRRWRAYPTEIESDEFARRWMFDFLAVLLRAWQIPLFELHERSRALVIVALVIVVLTVVIQNLLFHYIVGIHFYPGTGRAILCLHHAFNLLERISELEIFRAILQIKYPGQPTITDELVICNKPEWDDEKFVLRFFRRWGLKNWIHQFNSVRRLKRVWSVCSGM